MGGARQFRMPGSDSCDVLAAAVLLLLAEHGQTLLGSRDVSGILAVIVHIGVERKRTKDLVSRRADQGKLSVTGHGEVLRPHAPHGRHSVEFSREEIAQANDTVLPQCLFVHGPGGGKQLLTVGGIGTQRLEHIQIGPEQNCARHPDRPGATGT